MTRLGLLIVLSGAVLVSCDRWDGLTVRNDNAELIRVRWQLPGGREFPVYREGHTTTDVPPGETAEAGSVGGPPDPQPDIIVRAYSADGTLIFCRRLGPSEYNRMTERAPLSLKAGDIRCK